MTNAEVLELINAYTANLVAAEPELPVESVYATVAALVLNYAAAAVDPGTYAYHPHPNTEAEAILHHAAAHLLAEVA